jgi:hypothetical protein
MLPLQQIRQLDYFRLSRIAPRRRLSKDSLPLMLRWIFLALGGAKFVWSTLLNGVSLLRL